MLVSLLGFVLLGLVLADALWSTLSAQGGGPLSRRLMRGVWTALASGTDYESARRRIGGLAVLLALAVLWIGLLWSGWLLVFSGSEGAVVHGQSGAPADLPARIYFAGYTIFTLGLGDYVPGGGLWQILTALASLSGLFLITLAITYLVPVLSAVAESRRLASGISALGLTPGTFVSTGWNGAGFGGLERQLERLADALTLHTERHLLYPVLHFFHSSNVKTALPPNVAVLSDALLLLRVAVAPDARPDPASLAAIDGALDTFVETLAGTYVEEAEPPPLPSLDALRACGVPLTSDALPVSENDSDRRRRLHAFVRQGGWTWPGP